MSNVLVSSGGTTLKALGGGTQGSALPKALTSVSGTVSDGNTLTITGTSLGTGPEYSVFDDYSTATVGVSITNNFTSGGGVGHADSRSGSVSAQVFTDHGAQWSASISRQTLTGNPTEVFASYAIKVPSGARFPGTSGGVSGTNADYDDSSWKTAWFYGDGSGEDPAVSDGGFNDLVMGTHIGGGTWSHSGNDLGTLKTWGTDPTWWEWTKWNRFTTFVRAADTSPETKAGKMYFQVANTVDTLFEDTTTPTVFANGTAAPYSFYEMSFPGWLRETATQNDVEVLYDDVYIAWGRDASDRVELGNASTYENCTDLAICDASSWTGTSITVTCREGGLDLTAATWMYITLADNTERVSIQVVTP